MAITNPPEAPAPPPSTNVTEPTESPPSHTPEPTAPIPGTRTGGMVGGLLLICIGVTALFAIWLPGGGAWLFLGLGAAFLLARILTSRTGYAVPAGILLGFGAFIWLTETGMLQGPASGGVFFICLGLGFLLSYAIAARPQAVWPVVPGLVLIGFGAFVQSTTFGMPYAQFWWLADYWPLFLVAAGAWLLFRDRLPIQARTPVAITGTALLILIGLLVAASVVTGAGVGSVRSPLRMPAPWPMFQMPIGNPPLQDSITLSAPTDGVSSIQLVNTSGTTVVRSTGAPEVTVRATRHFWVSDQAPQVQLIPSGSDLIVDVSGINGTYVDYVVEAPATVGADIRSASGAVTVSGLRGPVHISSASGAVDARDLQGSTSIDTASGAIRLSNFAGAPAQITSISGAISVGFTPAASVHIDASSTSGDVRASGLDLTQQTTGPHSLSANVANGGPTVSAHTTSGSIRFLRG